ncbi:MAG: nucleotidyltransferase domain-containing protein [Candidatus Thermoplasmatota archaeon]
MDKKNFETIKKDFLCVKQDKRVLSVLLFGSAVNENFHKKSDIDIALVVPGVSSFYYDCKNVSNESVDSSEILRKVFRMVNTVDRNYDVHIFEELPLFIQIDIIGNHVVVYTSDRVGMFEYFYRYRKLWNDQKHRNTMSKDLLLSNL